MDGTAVLNRVRSDVIDVADHLVDAAEHLPFAERIVPTRWRPRPMWRVLAPWVALGAGMVLAVVAIACVLRGRGTSGDDAGRVDVSGTGETPARVLGADDDGDRKSRFERSA